MNSWYIRRTAHIHHTSLSILIAIYNTILELHGYANKSKTLNKPSTPSLSLLVLEPRVPVTSDVPGTLNVLSSNLVKRGVELTPFKTLMQNLCTYI